MSNNALGFFWLFTICFLAVLSMSKKLQELLGKILAWIFTAIVGVTIFLGAAWVLGSVIDGASKKVTNSFVETGSCDRGGVYSKHFNCEYIYNKATYHVYYWRYLNSENSNRYVETVVGLSACRDTAIYAHRDANERMKQELEWNERMYVCMLTKDSRNLEKHRY